MMKDRIPMWTLMAMGLIVTFLIGDYAVQSLVHAQERSGEETSSDDMDMNCPMMTRLKSIELYADSPALLLARAEDIGLDEQQTAQLTEIATTAREQARTVLNENQRQQLGELPAGPLSPMEIGRTMGMNEQMEGADSAKMCPMCMNMMKHKMSETGR